MGLRGGGKRAAVGSGSGSRGRSKTSLENPFKEVKMITVTDQDQSLFERAFINSVKYCSTDRIDSLYELSQCSSESLENILTYVQIDKARHSDKVFAIGGMLSTVQQMEKVKQMIDSAIGQYRKSFAESLWEKCSINDEFDPAEMRSLLRSAKEKAKDRSTNHWFVVFVFRVCK